MKKQKTLPRRVSDDTQRSLPLDKIYAVSMFLAISKVDFLERINAFLQESKAKRLAEELATQDNNCAKFKISGSRSFGVTIGGSTVGFCTPGNSFLCVRLCLLTCLCDVCVT